MNRTIRLCALAGRDGIAAPVPRAAVFVPPTSYQKGTVTDPPLHGQTEISRIRNVPKRPAREATEICFQNSFQSSLSV